MLCLPFFAPWREQERVRVLTEGHNMSLDEPIPNFLLTYFCDNCEILWQDRYDSTPDARCHICRTYWRPFTQDGEVSWETILDKEVKKRNGRQKSNNKRLTTNDK